MELMRNHEIPESLVILASALDLLLLATDGMLVEHALYPLPQLESHKKNIKIKEQLLEATARAVQPVLEWGETGVAVADGLSYLLKCRLPATVRCLSHPSAHVRALSISILRAILHAGLMHSGGKQIEINGIHNPAYQCLNVYIINWQADIVKCLTWEADSRLATGMPIQFLDAAAKELRCPISI